MHMPVLKDIRFQPGGAEAQQRRVIEAVGKRVVLENEFLQLCTYTKTWATTTKKQL